MMVNTDFEETSGNVEWFNEETVIIHISGDMTKTTEEIIKQTYEQASNLDAKNIILNFSGNDYIDSAGITILISLASEARQRNQRMLIAGFSDHFKKISHIIGLTRYAEIGTLEEVLNWVQNRPAEK